MKHKSSCKMSKCLGMQVPRGFFWWVLHQLPIVLQTYTKASWKNSDGDSHIIFKQMCVSSSCLIYLSFLQLGARSCSEARVGYTRICAFTCSRNNLSQANIFNSRVPNKEQKERLVGTATRGVGHRERQEEVYSLILQYESGNEATWSNQNVCQIIHEINYN